MDKSPVFADHCHHHVGHTLVFFLSRFLSRAAAICPFSKGSFQVPINDSSSLFTANLIDHTGHFQSICLGRQLRYLSAHFLRLLFFMQDWRYVGWESEQKRPSEFIQFEIEKSQQESGTFYREQIDVVSNQAFSLASAHKKVCLQGTRMALI